jgi:TolB-like protein
MKSKSILLFLFLGFILTLPSPSIAQSRDPNKVYKVAILPFMTHTQENLDYLREGINDILTSRIAVEERVVVIERSIVERALYEEKPMRLDEAAATKIGTRIGADYIVFGSITKIGEYISLDARLVSIAEEKPPVTVYTQQKGIDDVMVKLGDFAQDIGYKILGRSTMAGRPGEPRRPSKGMIERVDRFSGPQGWAQSRSGSNVPVITHAFTVEKIKYGDILKVYIEAEDPTGDMFKIATVVDQAGYGRYPASWVYVKPTDRKHFKGYLQWNTFSSQTGILPEGSQIYLTVSVFNKFGIQSNAFAFPITFESGVKRASSYQVPSPFDQSDVTRLGYINIDLYSPTSQGRGR